MAISAPGAGGSARLLVGVLLFPKGAEAFYSAPLDKAGTDPTRCANKRPNAPLSTGIKLLELPSVRRILSYVEKRISQSHSAFRQTRSAEILLSDVDRFVAERIRTKKTTYVVGMDLAGALDSATLIKLGFQTPSAAWRAPGWPDRRSVYS